MSHGNYFFKLNKDWRDDFYTFRADKWYCAAGDFMVDPSKRDLQEYFENHSVEIEWREEADHYGYQSLRIQEQ